MNRFCKLWNKEFLKRNPFLINAKYLQQLGEIVFVMRVRELPVNVHSIQMVGQNEIHDGIHESDKENENQFGKIKLEEMTNFVALFPSTMDCENELLDAPTEIMYFRLDV